MHLKYKQYYKCKIKNASAPHKQSLLMQIDKQASKSTLTHARTNYRHQLTDRHTQPQYTKCWHVPQTHVHAHSNMRTDTDINAELVHQET